MEFIGDHYAEIEATGDYQYYSAHMESVGSTFNTWIYIVDADKDQTIFCK